MNTEFVQILLSIAIVIIGIAGAYAITAVASFYKTKREQLLKDAESIAFIRDNDMAKEAVELIDQIIYNVVCQLDDTLKKELLNDTKDGKLTEEEKVRLKNMAMDLVTDQIAEPLKEKASSIIGSLPEYVSTVIENHVTKLKAKKAAEEYLITLDDELPDDEIE
jgi:hypothetical protein